MHLPLFLPLSSIAAIDEWIQRMKMKKRVVVVVVEEAMVVLVELENVCVNIVWVVDDEVEMEVKNEALIKLL